MPTLTKGSNTIVVNDKNAKQFIDNGWKVADEKPVETVEETKEETKNDAQQENHDKKR